MGLEVATYIDDLVATNPTGGDDRTTADDHIRLLKSTIKNTWPNVTGAITATHTQHNDLVGNYVTGTFTPVVTGGTSAGTGTYSRQVGRYTRIGNMVSIRITMAWSAHTGTGDLRITGLPYTSVDVDGHNHSLSVSASNLTFTSGQYVTGYILPNTDYLILRQNQGAGAIDTIQMDSSVSVLVITGSYEVA